MLKTEVIEVNGQTLVLCETTLRTDHLRAEMLKQASTEQNHDTLDDLTRWAYPSLAACILNGIPPTREEFVNLPLRELSIWRETAQRLNPDWFAAPPDQPDDDEQQEKKLS